MPLAYAATSLVPVGQRHVQMCRYRAGEKGSVVKSHRGRAAVWGVNALIIASRSLVLTHEHDTRSH